MEESEKSYYILVNGIRRGPFTREELSLQNISLSTMVWCAGFSDWIAARNVPELSDILSALPPELPEELTMPKTWLVESILVTVLCCLPFGIVGIVYASKVKSYAESRRYDEALRASSTAKSWVLAGFIIGLLVGTFYVFLYLIYIVS